MRKIWGVLMLVLLASTATAQQASQARREPGYDVGAMYKMHFTKVNNEFSTAGQPTLDELARLKAGGYKAIINLRTPREHDAAAEEARAKELGLRYFNIPVVYMDPKNEQVDEFLKLTDDAKNRPALIHCTMAIRVSAFWMIRRVLRDGWSMEKAEEEAERLGPPARHLKTFAQEYIAKKKSTGTSPRPAASTAQQPEATAVLEGLDPVLLAAGKEAQGDQKISVTRGRFQYMFSSEANKAAFEREPERYVIQLRGACARMGAPVTGNPDLWAVHDGRIYIFGSEDCVKTFRAAPAKFMEPATTASAAKAGDERKGRKLIERAVMALGGATRVDALTSYQEEQVTQVTTPRGEMAFRTVTRMTFAEGAEGEKKNRTGYKSLCEK